MDHRYEPVILDTRMSDYGYWIVTISAAPGERFSIMVATIGITQQEAEALVTEAAPLYPVPKGRRLCPMPLACPDAVTGARSDVVTRTIT